MARSWRGLCPAANCSGMMMMIMIVKNKITLCVLLV
jgi:hypothetical protein